jgi:radical SAM protein with 4Fe4S-binding SPASM domain
MERIFIPGKVVFHIESDDQVGTLHNLKSGMRAYVNIDTIEIIKHLLDGNALETFFPEEILHEEREKLIHESETIIRKLVTDGLLTEKMPNKQGIIKDVKTNPPLRVVFIELTKSCNLRCKHCYVPDCNNNVVLTEKIQIGFSSLCDLISQIDDLGVMEIQFTGGEPFVLPYMLDVIKETNNRLIPCSIFTNGTLLNENFFRYLSQDHHGMIFYVSLDGYQNTHDTFRGSKGAFFKTIKTINRLHEMGYDVRINTSIGRHNILEMPKFIEYIKNEFSGIMHRLVTVEAIGRANMEMTIRAEEFANLLQGSNHTFEFLDSHDSNDNWTTPACGICSSMLFIDAYGNVSFCPTLTQKENPDFLAGNIANDSLKNIWESSSIFNKYRGSQCADVRQCKFSELCKGGCRSRAYLSTGDINSIDRTMCVMYNSKQIKV